MHPLPGNKLAIPIWMYSLFRSITSGAPSSPGQMPLLCGPAAVQICEASIRPGKFIPHTKLVIVTTSMNRRLSVDATLSEYCPKPMTIAASLAYGPRVDESGTILTA